MKKLIVFDLDGTLAESKSPLDVEMANEKEKIIGSLKEEATTQDSRRRRPGARSSKTAEAKSLIPR
jgi:FMN phosphatase YigB (HAD superfamily)